MLVLIVLLVPVGLACLIASFVVLAAISKTVGIPGGALGSVFGITWLAGTSRGSRPPYAGGMFSFCAKMFDGS